MSRHIIKTTIAIKTYLNGATNSVCTIAWDSRNELHGLVWIIRYQINMILSNIIPKSQSLTITMYVFIAPD